jgi:starvation-inducible DNA-binding protein
MPEQLFRSLNLQVANFSVLYTKLHHYHWFVKGNSFFTLHEKFQKDYEEITEYVDELAERLIQIGGKPISTMKEYLIEASLKENHQQEDTADKMVTALVRDYQQVVEELSDTIETAGNVGDNVTEDLLISISSSLEKKIWLYNAFLNK